MKNKLIKIIILVLTSQDFLKNFQEIQIFQKISTRKKHFLNLNLMKIDKVEVFKFWMGKNIFFMRRNLLKKQEHSLDGK